MSIRAGLEQYILQTHNSKKSEDSPGGGGLNPPPNPPLWVRQWAKRTTTVIQVGIITCDLPGDDLLVVSLDDVAQFVVMHDAHVMGAIARVLHHHVRQMQPA